MLYVPLHVHSTASGPEGIMGVREIVSRASFLGFGALAITDHRTTYGHFEFFEAARGAGIKPVLGAEIQHASLVSADGVFHLTVLAENGEGYRNLCALISRYSFREKEPHVGVELLERHRAGLIVLTGCLRGEAAQAILHGNLGRSRDVLARLEAIFGASNVFIEIMNHGRPEESLVADQLRDLSARAGIPCVITNNDRYLQREDAEYFRIARRIGRKKAEGEAEEPVQEYYLKRERELVPFFGDERGAFDRSGEIAARCAVDLPRPGRISFSSAPAPHDALIDMCRRRFVLAFHAKPADERSRVKRALERELALARDEELSGFFLFLRELFTSAGEQGIWLELMGSDLLESIIAHLLEISPLNPVDHDLVFHRKRCRSRPSQRRPRRCSRRPRSFVMRFRGSSGSSGATGVSPPSSRAPRPPGGSTTPRPSQRAFCTRRTRSRASFAISPSTPRSSSFCRASSTGTTPSSRTRRASVLPS
ncbi:MAG: PHP domain-containing protein [Candidatus Krumholzibacteriaceae bacterium]